MKTLVQLSEELSLSPDAVRRRLNMLKGYGLNGCERGGPHGSLLIPDEVCEILRKAVNLERQTGLPMRKALNAVLREGTAPEPSAPPTPAPSADLGGRSAPTYRDPYLRLLWALVLLLAVLGAGMLAVSFLAVLAR